MTVDPQSSRRIDRAVETLHRVRDEVGRVVVVEARERSRSARRPRWARASYRPVPQSWYAAKASMSRPTVTRTRPTGKRYVQ